MGNNKILDILFDTKDGASLQPYATDARVLEILVEREALLDGLVISVGTDRLVDTGFGVGRYTRFEEVGLAL